MKKIYHAILLGATFALASCGSKGSLFKRGGPDEFAVGRQPPLVVPPDYELRPPRPGAPRPMALDASDQALRALFGDDMRRQVRPLSSAEKILLDQAGAAQTRPGARLLDRDGKTVQTVDKGSLTLKLMEQKSGDQADSSARILSGAMKDQAENTPKKKEGASADK